MSEAIEYNDGTNNDQSAEAGAAEAAAAAALAQAEALAQEATHEVNLAVSEAMQENVAPDTEPVESKAHKRVDSKIRQRDTGDLEEFYMCLDSLKIGGLVQKGRHVVGVHVEDPQTQKALTGSFTSYAVSVEPPIEEIRFVRRRYSDFVWLRKWLGLAFPGVFIPSLPPKSLFGKMKESFIEERRHGLEEFMKRLISRHRFIIHSMPFQLFISKHSNTFDKQKRDVERLIMSQKDDNVAKMFQSLFPELAGSNMPTDPLESCLETVLTYDLHTQTLAKQIQLLLESSALIADKWGDICLHSKKITSSLKSLGKVEDGYAQRPDPPRMDVSGMFQSWSGVVSEKPDHWSEGVVSIFKQEKLDIESMLIIVKTWESIQKRLSKAMERMEKYKKIDGELNEKQKAAEKKDKDALEEVRGLHTIITKILFESEVVYYWENKTSSFNSQVQTFFEKQFEVSSKLVKLWAEEKKY
eukprot:jgi/Bigna1/68606/fgenesh1_pg.6_\